MNPIALLGVASTGLSLIRSLNAAPSGSTKKPFAEYLQENSLSATSPAEYVKNQGIHTVEDLHSHLQDLKNELKNKLQIESPSEDANFILAFEGNGTPYIENEVGQHISLPQELHPFAKQIGQLAYLESQMAYFPNSSLWNQATLMPQERWNSTTL